MNTAGVLHPRSVARLTIHSISPDPNTELLVDPRDQQRSPLFLPFPQSDPISYLRMLYRVVPFLVYVIDESYAFGTVLGTGETETC